MRQKIQVIKRGFLDGMFDNGSYKLVALFIALILWLTILGRREFVINKEVDVDFTVAENLSLAGQSADRIRLKLSGPQPLLRKYKESTPSLQINLADRAPGLYDIEMTPSRIDVPVGIKILGVKPPQIRVEITSKD